ncbi:DUF397 domain-containing protein [Streptomyces sp. C10-9-1]|uniref:DUF397 domain-containing protein n=1 Tax=Streptomyces sp. C10-9-1 TaxID=1859285 RepID=UPI003F4A6C52
MAARKDVDGSASVPAGTFDLARSVPDTSVLVWRKSTYSNTSGGDCLEVADGVSGAVPVRDSTRPEGPVVVVGAGAWALFVGGLRRGVR